MEKPSETLDLLDKITELRNCYVDEQKQNYLSLSDSF